MISLRRACEGGAPLYATAISQLHTSEDTLKYRRLPSPKGDTLAKRLIGGRSYSQDHRLQ